MMMTTPILMIYGPTASGKSALAMQIAQRRDGVVINADATQLYADLQILSARPLLDEDSGFRIQDSVERGKEAAPALSDAPCERQNVAQRGQLKDPIPHKLYGVLQGDQHASAASWTTLAMQEIHAAWAVGKLPILCGGTGLYLKALEEGLSAIPDIPDSVREEARMKSNAEILEVLQQRDPEIAARLKAGDTQRLQRAYEVFLATDKPLSYWQAQPKKPPLPQAEFVWETLNPPREELYARCNARFIQMLKQGAIEEVESLLAKNYPASAPVMKAVGVPEISAYLRGEISLEEATSKAQQATRNYAKRQVTWLRNQLKT